MKQLDMFEDDMQHLIMELRDARARVRKESLLQEMLQRQLVAICQHPREYSRTERVSNIKSLQVQHVRYCDLCGSIIR